MHARFNHFLLKGRELLIFIRAIRARVVFSFGFERRLAAGSETCISSSHLDLSVPLWHGEYQEPVLESPGLFTQVIELAEVTIILMRRERESLDGYLGSMSHVPGLV